MGNLDLYRRLLKGFAKTQHEVPAQLAALTNRVTEQSDWLSFRLRAALSRLVSAG